MNIKFKTVCFKDKLYIWDVYKAAMIAHIEKIWGWNESWQENDFSKNLKKYKTFVIVVNDIPLGYIQYKENKDNVYINMIILEPSYQGNKIGKYILIKLQEQSLNKPIRLKCFKKNKRAYKFYKNNGFELIEEDLDFYLLCLSNKIIG